MQIKRPRKEIQEAHPSEYTLAFDVTQWNHGGSSDERPIPFCDTEATPWRFTFPAFLLWQLGYPPKDICPYANPPGVQYGQVLYAYRYLDKLPKGLGWWADLVDYQDMTHYISGTMKVTQFPDWPFTTKEVPAFKILDALNSMRGGLTPTGKYETLTESWRAFWLREFTRVLGGISVQFHSPRGEGG